jgi:hypothetical protein
MLWAAHGVAHLRRWSAFSRLPDVGLAALALVLAISLVTDVEAARSADAPLERSAGAWIAAHTHQATIVDVSTRTAFYAGGVWSPLPYGDERAARRYLTARHPTYVVLDSRRAGQYPPLRRWFADGLPATLGRRVLTLSDGTGRVLSLYRWNGSTANL